MNRLLISLHLPKTGGNSFLQALEAAFGPGLKQDYADMSRIQAYLAGELAPESLAQAQSDILAPGMRCIHGHFLPAKYLPLQRDHEVRFVTWLRDPVERLVSHYYFFRRSYDPNTAGPLFRRIIEEGWSLERFCLSEEYRNLYSRYLWHFPYEAFDFIGLIEAYDEDLEYFSSRFLGRKLEALRLNAATDSERNERKIDPGLRREIEDFHAQDVSLYRRALRDREQRT